MKKPKLAVLPYKHHPKYKFVLDLRAFGRGRKFFKSRAAAEAERTRQKTTLERHGREAIGLPQPDLSDFIRARQRLAAHGKTITDATTFYLDHLERVQRCNVTVSQLATELIQAKRKDGMSKAYLSDLELRLRHFRADFGNKLIASITMEEIDNWLRGLHCSPKSRTNYRANIGVLFSYARKRRMITENPVEFTAKPKLPNNPPEIFKVDELRTLLESAQKTSPDVLPMLAIGAFAGLRDAEIKRLHWSEVDLGRGHVEVKGPNAKSARRRIVQMQPNLQAWLRSYTSLSGSVMPTGARKRLDAVKRGAGFGTPGTESDKEKRAGIVLTAWPKNGLRHSFASYRLAAINNAPHVSAELGHTSPALLYNTYRELVWPSEAERYWKIEPAEQAGKVVAFAAAR